jgi:putative peptide zinc metalloprotease protein
MRTIDYALADRQDRLNRLVLRANVEGQLVAPELHEMVGRFVQGGQEVAMIARPDHLTIHVLAEQKDVQPIVHGLDGRQNVATEVRFAGDLLRSYKGGRPREYGMADEKARSASLTSLAGTTDVPTDPKDPQKFLIPQFDIGVPMDNPEGRFVLGQRAYVRFTLDKKPLVWQWTRRFWQLIQTKSSSSPWI